MAYHALKHEVLNRGVAPDSFLDELVAWGKTADDDIFAPNAIHDIYSNVVGVLGPWRRPKHRRAVMLEVMRVLAGFESSWRWQEGADPDTEHPEDIATLESGAWQVSADSMRFGPELKTLVESRAGAIDPITFRAAMKSDHLLAMEYIARLLRRTVDHNGPVKRHEIDPWLRKDAVEELETILP
jgi:hypothetical protein